MFTDEHNRRQIDLSVTGSEDRWLFRHNKEYSEMQFRIKHYGNEGQEIKPSWETDPELWEKYQHGKPKLPSKKTPVAHAKRSRRKLSFPTIQPEKTSHSENNICSFFESFNNTRKKHKKTTKERELPPKTNKRLFEELLPTLDSTGETPNKKFKTC